MKVFNKKNSRKKTASWKRKTVNLILAAAAVVIIVGRVNLVHPQGQNVTAETDSSEYSFGSAGTEIHEGDVITYDNKQYQYNRHLSNYLLMGVDIMDEIPEEKRSISAGEADFLYLVSYDRKEEDTRILAIPRDTMTEIRIFNEDGEALGKTTGRLCTQYAYGDGKRKSCELTRDAVSHLLCGLPILGYAALNMDSIPLMTDVVGGVTLVLPDNSLQDVDPGFTRGSTVVITGENADMFLRYLDTNKHQQDLVRMDRQKVFVRAYAAKVKKMQDENPHTVTDIYETFKPHMITNMTNDVFLDLTAAWHDTGIETVPGRGINAEKDDEYEVDEKALYRLILDLFYEEVEEE